MSFNSFERSISAFALSTFTFQLWQMNLQPSKIGTLDEPFLKKAKLFVVIINNGGILVLVWKSSKNGKCKALQNGFQVYGVSFWIISYCSLKTQYSQVSEGQKVIYS